jgi:hypothetical protein
VRAFAEQITMLGLTMLLGAVGLGAFCRLFYNATIYALPCFVGLFVGFFAESTGAGLSAAITFGVAAGVLLLAIGQKILTLLRSPFLRAIVALTFAVPAALTGYFAVYNLAGLTAATSIWRQVFAIAGALAVGATAWQRLASPPDADTRDRHSPAQP